MKNKSKMIIYLLAGFLIIALTACSQADGGGSDYDATQPSGKQASLENSNWRLVSFGEEGSEAPVQEGTEITLIFDTGGEVGGSGGCNMYSGLYEIFDSNISFNQIVQTEMACTTEGVTEQETKYLDALKNAGEFERAGNQLLIWYSDGQSVMTFEPMEMDADRP